ncbi:MAG TPA: alpha-amylase family glycosyl hydrolase [Opitutus sp.]|nr:alpha-amylase family glycosyl hydrolase [Opitutus sp.]
MLPRSPRFFRAILAGCLFAIAAPGLSAAESPQICANQTAIGMPGWIRQAVIYEVNIRQYSAAGTFAAVTSDLPRLRDLGVDVLWLMPIYPIGEKNRKGPLGSYYAVRDYEAVNPEFGTERDFKALVDAAHAAGFHVILDWVGNHTAWDNRLAAQHPDFYVHDAQGNFTPPTGFDWTDVIQLDFSNPAVLDYEFGAMARWVRDFGVDGFRCDFATGVPTTFWNTLFGRLREIRPDLFFLAESELPQHQLHAFNASYAFDMMKTFNAVAQGSAGVSAIDDTLAAEHVQFPAGAALLYYTTNHDENSWAGTVFERLGGGVRPFAVLSFMLDGIPLIYDGQEVGLDHRLAFFEHDPIAWPHDHPLTAFYRTLCGLKHTEPALAAGASVRRIPTTKNESIYAILRSRGGSRVVAFLNLTARDVTADAFDPALAGRWRDVFTGADTTVASTLPLTLRSWEYRVLRSEK